MLRPGLITRLFSLLLCLAACGPGCGRIARDKPDQPPGNSGSTVPPLRIAAASDLQVALPVLANRFQAKTRIKTSLTFDASGRLAEQIRNGAPFDLFMAANTAFVEDLVKEQMIVPDSVELYAKGSLVLVVYRELGDRIKTLSDLKKPEVKKIALANPAFAPYGKAARQALEKAGLSKELEPKLVQAESVKQALVYAQRGDAEAALVGRSLADVPELHIVWVDRTLYDPIVQAMGISTRTSLSNEALAFSRFLMSEEGQDILGTFGFMPVETRVTLPAGGIAR